MSTVDVDRTWTQVAGVVWPVADAPATAGTPGAPAAASALGAAVPGGADEAYRLVRFAGRVRYVVDRSLTRRARRRVLLYGNRLRAPRRRLARSALASTFLLGTARSTAGVEHARDALRLRRRVAHALGRDEADVHLTFAVHDRDGAPRPTVLAVDRDGAPLLFLKLGTGGARRVGLERERDAVDRVVASVPRGVVVPARELWASSGDVSVLGLRPLPADVAPVAPGAPEETWAALDALVAAHPRSLPSLATSPWVRRLRAEALRLETDERSAVRELGHRGLRLVDAYVACHGHRALPHGLRHGDWSSWNLGWSGDDLVVWDWEYGEECAPLALDRHNWFFARATSIEGREAADAGRVLLADTVATTAGAVPVDALTARLYLLDMAVRRSVLAAGGETRSLRAADGLLALLTDDLR